MHVVPAHEDILARERLAWTMLQYTREAGTLAQRKQRLEDWLAAVRDLRQAQAERTGHAVAAALAGLRECMPLLAHASAAPPTTIIAPDAATALPLAKVPRHSDACMRETAPGGGWSP